MRKCPYKDCGKELSFDEVNSFKDKANYHQPEKVEIFTKCCKRIICVRRKNGRHLISTNENDNDFFL